jgi:hypothetical protein
LMTENKPNEVHNLKNQVMKIVPDFPGLNRWSKILMKKQI